jgi:hypothetical protein
LGYINSRPGLDKAVDDLAHSAELFIELSAFHGGIFLASVVREKTVAMLAEKLFAGPNIPACIMSWDRAMAYGAALGSDQNVRFIPSC